jgi:Zn-dependent metalloprotease
VNFIGSHSPNGIKTSTNLRSAIATNQQNAQNFLNTYAPDFGVSNPSTNLKLKKSFSIDGQETFKYNQSHRNIPILGAEINVNLAKDGSLLAMNGETATDLNLDTTPQVSANQALNTALTVAQKQDKLDRSNIKASKPELQIYQPGIFDPGDGPAKPQLLFR